ncbi:PPK2 family polyphosphate kinase [Promineifilum sp.]|uniref:PPK2 family polyphosphate kinase n=1 Tax=Promineifilum sp. TaxID=2664178 RepID=UPI0035B1E1B8
MAKKDKGGKRAPAAAPVRELLRVGPGFRLADVDARRVVAGPADKVRAAAEVGALEPEVTEWQEKLYAESKGGGNRRLLVVLQGMDTSGKGGAIKAIDRVSEPLGLRIAQFGAPTKKELKKHYLWRIEQKLPPPGAIGVFDRSHYEDVLVVRVRNLVPADIWEPRYDEINAWEKACVEAGVTFLKCMLFISPEEQRQRLLDRLADPTKQWKYRPGDVDDRLLWPDFMEAYEAALTRCSTDHAPWYVIPADRKWHRNWLLARMVVETLREMNPQYPATTFDVAAETRRVQES